MQTPAIIFDFVGTVAAAAVKESKQVPVIGMARIRGLLWASADGTVEIWQGANDKGVLQNRHVERHKFSDTPTNTVPIDLPVWGKFVQVRILNDIAGADIIIEGFVSAMEKS